MVIEIKLHDTKLPSILPQGDWIDLEAAEDVELNAPILNVHTNEIEFHSGLISLGVSIKLPEGYEAHLLPRSSLFKKKGILMSCSTGIIDHSYNGNNDVWKFPFVAFRKASIKKGERIAQFRVMPSQKSYKGGLEFVEVEDLKTEDRGGFGSTGN